FRRIGRQKKRKDSGSFRPKRRTSFLYRAGRRSSLHRQVGGGRARAVWKTAPAATTFGGRGRPTAGEGGRELAQSIRPDQQVVDSKDLIVRDVAVRSCIQYARDGGNPSTRVHFGTLAPSAFILSQARDAAVRLAARGAVSFIEIRHTWQQKH